MEKKLTGNDLDTFLISEDGKKYGPYDNAEANYGGYIVVREGKKGFVTEQDGEIIPCKKYMEISPDWDFYEGKMLGFIVIDGRNMGYVNNKGEEVIPCKYFSVGKTKNGYIVGNRREDSYNDEYVERLSNLGFCDKNGEEILPCEFYAVKEENGYLIAQQEKNGKLGLYSLDGKNILPFEFDAIQPSEDVILVRVDKNYGLYNLEGQLIVPCEYKKIKNYGKDFELTKSDGSVEYCNKNGVILENIERE